MPLLAALMVLLLASSARAETQQGQGAARTSERVTCSIAAALKFGLPAYVLLAVAEMEGGRPGQWVRNRNGSYDVGPLQFNTCYLDHLQRYYGITAADVAAAGCYSYELAAWRLRKHLELDRGDPWTRFANYHSRSPDENATYRDKLIRAAARWSLWLSQRFAATEPGGERPSHQAIAADSAKRQGKSAVRRQQAAEVPGQERSEARTGDSQEEAALLGLLADDTGTVHKRSSSRRRADTTRRAGRGSSLRPAGDKPTMLELLER